MFKVIVNLLFVVMFLGTNCYAGKCDGQRYTTNLPAENSRYSSWFADRQQALDEAHEKCLEKLTVKCDNKVCPGSEHTTPDYLTHCEKKMVGKEEQWRCRSGCSAKCFDSNTTYVTPPTRRETPTQQCGVKGPVYTTNIPRNDSQYSSAKEDGFEAEQEAKALCMNLLRKKCANRSQSICAETESFGEILCKDRSNDDTSKSGGREQWVCRTGCSAVCYTPVEEEPLTAAEQQRLLAQLDQLDAMDLMNALQEAKDALGAENFAAAERHLAIAGQFVGCPADKNKISVVSQALASKKQEVWQRQQEQERLAREEKEQQRLANEARTRIEEAERQRQQRIDKACNNSELNEYKERVERGKRDLEAKISHCNSLRNPTPFDLCSRDNISNKRGWLNKDITYFNMLVEDCLVAQGRGTGRDHHREGINQGLADDFNSLLQTLQDQQRNKNTGRSHQTGNNSFNCPPGAKKHPQVECCVPVDAPDYCSTDPYGKRSCSPNCLYGGSWNSK